MCLLALVGGVALGVRAWRDYRAHARSPIETTLDGVPEHATSKAWVTLANGSWRCDHPLRPLRSNSKQVVLWDGSSSVVVIADFQSNVQCSSLTPAHARGTVSRLEPGSRYAKRLEDSGLRINEALSAYSLCTYCGPTNDLLGVLVGVLLIGIGVGGLLWHRAAERKQREGVSARAR